MPVTSLDLVWCLPVRQVFPSITWVTLSAKWDPNLSSREGRKNPFCALSSSVGKSTDWKAASDRCTIVDHVISLPLPPRVPRQSRPRSSSQSAHRICSRSLPTVPHTNQRFGMEKWSIEHLVLKGDDHSMVSTSDVVLDIGNQSFPVHSQILSIKSSFFRGLLGNLGTGGPTDKTIIPLKDVNGDDLSNLLKLMYREEQLLSSKEDMAGVWLLAKTFDIPNIEKELRETLNAPDWMMHCAGYSVGSLMANARRRSALKTPMRPGDENDAIRWLAIADKIDMGSLQVKCYTILLKFITSTMDYEKEAIGRDEMDKHLNGGLMFDLARMAGAVREGSEGQCACGVPLLNGETVCYSCAKAIVEGMGSSSPGPSG